MDGTVLRSGGSFSDDSFAATGEEVGIADFLERFMIVDVDRCEGGDCDGRQ